MYKIGTAELIQLGDLFLTIIKNDTSEEAYQWLIAKAKLVRSEEKSTQLNLTFSQLPRKTGKAVIDRTATIEAANTLFPGFSIDGWNIDRLARVWLLMQISPADKASYLQKINGLLTGSEMQEQVALYSALPFYAYPEEWIPFCENGIRSNIGIAQEAIMYDNPYPAAYLSENAFNQLVLKTFFTEKDVTRIVGLEQRMNQPLADTLADYVDERTAAHRTVEPNIYKLIELRNQI